MRIATVDQYNAWLANLTPGCEVNIAISDLNDTILPFCIKRFLKPRRSFNNGSHFWYISLSLTVS
jgi:hypothetical protein|tara:strand:+ start:1695 stop:1889 length:195 start_codon:yes stop_codon:yes gene_type:complete